MACGACEQNALKSTDTPVFMPASIIKQGVYTEDMLKKATEFNSLKPPPMIYPTPNIISLPKDVDKTLPSYKDMIFGLTENIKGALMQVVKGGAMLADKDVVENRINLCINCEYFIHNQSRCSKCGCFMTVKTRIQSSKCPVGKW